mmetsp:Transcript_13452/g.1974  ORF Transcript_13452/g.1974 Transcript_13452/m.1974 type:complete len:84 (+) Transcript_13452:70-321(+)
MNESAKNKLKPKLDKTDESNKISNNMKFTEMEEFFFQFEKMKNYYIYNEHLNFKRSFKIHKENVDEYFKYFKEQTKRKSKVQK